MESKSTESSRQAPNGLKRPAHWLSLLLLLALVGSGCDLSAGAHGPGAAVLAPGAQVVSVGTATGEQVEASYEARVGQQALQQITYDWQTKLPGWTKVR